VKFFSQLLNWVKSRPIEPAHLVAGRWGEEQARLHLERRGYTCLGERVRVGRRDEIDLVMRQGETLVFVEVKTRQHEEYGRPIAAVNRAKRAVLSRAAIRYLKVLRFPRRLFRFDVVEVIGSPDRGKPRELRHIENAFQLDSRYRIPG
jgi:putative endonuclease